MATDRVDLIDEDQAGGQLLPLLEEVSDPGGPDTHEELDEVRPGDGEERNLRLSGYGLGQEGLPASGRTNQKGALGNPTPKLLKLLRVAEELDDLRELLFRLIDPGHVLEGHLLLFVVVEEFRLALSEAEGGLVTSPPLHLADDEDPEDEDEHQGQPSDQEVEPAPFGGFLDLDLQIGVALAEPLDKVGGIAVG